MRKTQRLAINHCGRIRDGPDLGEVKEEAGVESFLVRLEEFSHPLPRYFPATIDDHGVREMDTRAIPFLDRLVFRGERAVDDGDNAGDAPDRVRHERADRPVDGFHLLDDTERTVGDEDGRIFITRGRNLGLTFFQCPSSEAFAAFAGFAQDADFLPLGPGILHQFFDRIGPAGARGTEDDDEGRHALRPQRPKGAFCPRSRIQWSTATRAAMASTMGTARGRTHGSWRPLAVSSVALPSGRTVF